jgi:hypothetical protein
VLRSVVLTIALAGCGRNDTNVGRECGATAPNCDESLSCSSSVLGGYCTTACATPGSTSQCPDGSICDDTPELGISCLRLCDDFGDCERDGVACVPVTDSDRMACKPH